MDIVNACFFKIRNYCHSVSDIPAAGNIFIRRDAVSDNELIGDL